MEIAEIKAQLSIGQVLDHYLPSLKLRQAGDHKPFMINCPFHEDKTPSMQVYPETNTCYCFSGNCPTHGKSLDVIDFIFQMDQCSKHEAIKKAESLLTGETAAHRAVSQAEQLSSPADGQARIAVLTKMFSYFCHGVHNSKPAQDYIAGRCLDKSKLSIGYNSGQFHHGNRKDQALIASCLKYGLLLDKGYVNNRTGEKAYSPFGKSCIVFPLKNKKGQIVSLYFRSTTTGKGSPAEASSAGRHSMSHSVRHFYLKDRQGLYPHYPSVEARHLIITESIIDAATLLQLNLGGYEILALYGTNGLTAEHLQAIQQLEHLEAIIFFLNGDAPGRQATEKYSASFADLLPRVSLSVVEVPEGEDVNSLAQSHEETIFAHLLASSKPLSSPPTVSKQSPTTPKSTGLEVSPAAIRYQGQTANYLVKGLSKVIIDSLKITLFIEHPKTGRKSRSKVDLYEDKQMERVAREASGKLDLREDLITLDLEQLTDLLDHRREATTDKASNKSTASIPQASAKAVIDFLSKPNLLNRINELIGHAGVIGEETNRIFLFGIATSYKMPVTLHALIQGSSGSGKTHLLTAISKFIPREDKKHFTRVTEGSLYNYGVHDLSNKLICLEDLDGMKEEAYLAFRELQSRGMISSSTSGKDEDGNIRAYEKVVYGPIASMSCTTKGAIYEDNMNRCFLIAVDESKEQTARVIGYQNQLSAGKIDKAKQVQVTAFLQDCIRLLKPYQVINPYAGQVQLPQEAHKIRRLNELYQSYVKQVTLLHQYRRSKDKEGRLLSEKEDLQAAAETMFDSILLKIDELDGSLRLFYEQLKAYVQGKGDNHHNYSFTQREIRHSLHITKTRLSYFINQLIDLEYLQIISGHANRGYHYKISYWDNVEKLRSKVKRHLQGQLDQLQLYEGKHEGNAA